MYLSFDNIPSSLLKVKEGQEGPNGKNHIGSQYITTGKKNILQQGKEICKNKDFFFNLVTTLTLNVDHYMRVNK